MNQKINQKRFLMLIFIAGLLLDFITKQIIISMAYDSFWILSFPADFNNYTGFLFGSYFGFFNLVLVFNKGISFSMLSSNIEAMRWLLSAMSIFIVILIIKFIEQEKELKYKASLTLVIAGAIGNVIDRIRFGAVVDFLDFYIGKYHWPAFNVADICICTGVGLFLLFKALDWKSHKERIKNKKKK